jgi:hypothetical protein
MFKYSTDPFHATYYVQLDNQTIHFYESIWDTEIC